MQTNWIIPTIVACILAKLFIDWLDDDIWTPWG